MNEVVRNKVVLNNIIMNKIKKFTFVLIITCFISLFFGNVAFASSGTAYDIGEYIIDATVMKDGNMRIVEKIRFDFLEGANGIYRDILYRYEYLSQKDNMGPTSSRYQATNVLSISVSKTDEKYNKIEKFMSIDEKTAKNGMEDVYSLSDFLADGYVKRIKIYTPSFEDSRKYLKIEYLLEDVAVLYNDKGEIYWNFVGSGWDTYISNLKINIDFEGKSNEPIKIYPHGYTNIKNVSNINEKVSFEVPNLYPNVAVDARVVFSSEYLDSNSVVKKVNENYNFEELEKMENGMEMGKTRYNLSNIFTYIIVAIVVVYLVLLFIKSNKVSSKGKNKKIDYFTEPLENFDLSLYTKLNGGLLLNSNLLMATILDLKYKKVLDMDSKKRLKKTFDGVEYDYYLTINEKADLSKLNEYEKLVLNYLFNEKASDEITEFKEAKIELNKRFKELSTKYSEINRFNSICSKYDEKLKDIVLEKPNKNLKKFTFIFLIVIAIIAIINIFVISPLNFGIKMEYFMIHVIFGIMLLIFAVSLAYVRSLKEEYYDEYNKLKGLERYLKEYSKIKDRYPIEIELWDRYLVFATLFGIAKKVAKEFKEELIKNGYNDDYIYANYPILCMSMYSSEMSSYAATSTGSSSSGGYSGGGSGGGGRWWRRWRFFLKL